MFWYENCFTAHFSNTSSVYKLNSPKGAIFDDCERHLELLALGVIGSFALSQLRLAWDLEGCKFVGGGGGTRTR